MRRRMGGEKALDARDRAAVVEYPLYWPLNLRDDSRVWRRAATVIGGAEDRRVSLNLDYVVASLYKFRN